MKTHSPASPQPFLPHPVGRYQLWTWIAILASILVCLWIFWLHFKQQQTLSQMTNAITTMHLARIELSKGFLYATLDDDPQSPFDRDTGLALLQQAATSLEQAAVITRGEIDEGVLESFQQSLEKFEAHLLEFRAATTPQPGLQTELRLAFYDLERQADAIDLESHQALQALRSRLDLEFVQVMLGAGLLLLGIVSVMMYTGRAKDQADMALQESQANFETIFEYSPVAIGISRLSDGKITHLNAAFASLFGITREEALERTTAELQLWAYPEDRQRFIDQLHSQKQVRNFETMSYLKSGEDRYVMVSGELVNIGGEPSMMAQIVDITERKHEEQQRVKLVERLDLATRAARMGIWDWDIQKNEITWDDQMYALYGLQPGQFGGAYAAWLQGVHPEDRDASNEVSTAAVRGEREYDTEFRVLWPDGSVHWLKANGQVFRDGQNNPLRMVGVNYDITERKRLEESLRESEQKYTLLFEKSTVPTVLLKLPEVVIVNANEACENLTGFMRAEMFGKTSVELGLARKEARAQAISEFDSRGALAGNEINLFTKSGEKRIVVANTMPFMMGGEKYAITTMQDITERKLAEEGLMESEKRFSTAFFASPVSQSIIAQGTSEILAVNDACCRLFGYSREALIGVNTASLGLWENPSDRLAAVDELQRTGRLLSREATVRAKNGEIYTVMVAIEPISWKGQPCFISSLFDITERKKMEKLLRENERSYRELVQNANSAILRWKTDGTIIFFNEFAQSFFGYAPEEILGRPVGILVPETDSSGGDLSNLVQDIVTHPDQFVNVVNENICRDGRRVWMAWTNKPIYNEKGQPVEILAVGMDISERKRIEDELRRSNAELEQFAYVASHDLQEPLRTVAGMVQLLQQRYRGQLDARADEYIQFAVDASDRMQQLINDLLDFSRVERKGHPFAATNMEQVVKAALTNLQSAIAESGAQITLDPLPTVQADGGQLIQVLQNLIGNAIKFRGEKLLQIHISAEKLEAEWQFAVRDNGIGIDPQYFERVFLLFQRLHTRRKYPGTGIGLALCKKVIERHGGRMWIKSAVNQGATFFFTLPERS